MAPFSLISLLNDFMSAKDYPINVYNEVSLQHELGFYLRARLSGLGYSVYFEKNIKEYICPTDTKKQYFLKKEIDIVISDGAEQYGIELKYPRNGQYPKQMEEFLIDIAFIEQLKESGFIGGATLTLVDDPLFYNSGNASGYPYDIFRTNKALVIDKGSELKHATGEKKGQIVYHFLEKHITRWKKLSASWKTDDQQYYYIIAI